MWNKIAERLHPFSHLPGTKCCIPKSEWQVQVFPALLRFSKGEEVREFPISMRGPMREFTVELDLEKGLVRIFGKTPDGYLSYVISRREEGIAIEFEKSPSAENKSRLLIPENSKMPQAPHERLSLGKHRKQDWELVARRRDLAEIFPTLYRLSEWLPPCSVDKKRAGMFKLLDLCSAVVAKEEKVGVLPAFLNFFEAAFHGILSPRLFDDQFQGYLSLDEKVATGLSPLALLSESRALIRSLFIQEEGEKVSLLPCLPPEFHAGRFLGIQLKTGTLIDLEWSKKELRRMVIHPTATHSLSLEFPKSLKSFRLRRSLGGRGERLSTGTPLLLAPGETLYLDRFQK